MIKISDKVAITSSAHNGYPMPSGLPPLQTNCAIENVCDTESTVCTPLQQMHS